MDKEQNIIASSEETDVETLSSNVDEIKEATDPASTCDTDDRIKCTNSQSLREILGITLNHVEELANSCELKDRRLNFLSVFGESFKNALQENILVSGLPFIIDKNKDLCSPERVDDVLFSKLSKRVAYVAQERKFAPQQCRRILSIEMKHELQNLKKARVADKSSVPSTSLSSPNSLKTDRNRVKKFTDFCQGFTTMQETVQCKIQEKEKLSTKLSVINEVHKKQKLC